MHLKRYFAPKTWKVKRKENTFITRPDPGPHSIKISLPLNFILRDILKYGTTRKETRFIVQNRNVLIDGIKRTSGKFPVGLFDVLSVKDTDSHFRVLLDSNGRLHLVHIGKEESTVKPCKVTGKNAIKRKFQVNLYDGKNLLIEKDIYDVGDTLIIDFADKNHVKEHIKLDKNILIYLTGGKHIGQTGKVQGIIGDRIIYKSQEGVFETLKKYAFPIGKDKPAINLV